MTLLHKGLQVRVGYKECDNAERVFKKFFDNRGSFLYKKRIPGFSSARNVRECEMPFYRLEYTGYNFAVTTNPASSLPSDTYNVQTKGPCS